MFFERSEEARTQNGLGVMRGEVTRIRTRLKIPHIGWNSIKVVKKACPLFRRIRGGYVYFVHAYHAQPSEDVVAATTDYGCSITASVWKGKIFGVQFHPEKSGQLGLRMLRNFLDL
jgi:glutamine amidotransferase